MYAIIPIVIFALIFGNSVYALTASEFAFKYGDEIPDDGQQVSILVTVKGESQSQDPQKRAKEIRYLQSGALKFVSFAGGVNVLSDTWNNEFTATVTTSLAKVLERRGDVISVTILGTISEKIEKKNCSVIYPGADLSGCNLFALRAMNMDLRSVNFSNANLKGAWLQGSDLSGADLSHAFLRQALLNGVNFSNADLSYSKIINAEVEGADFTNANLYGATLYRADFTGSTMKNTNLGLSILTYANLSFVNLEGANLDESGTWGTNLNHCYNHEMCRR